MIRRGSLVATLVAVTMLSVPSPGLAAPAAASITGVDIAATTVQSDCGVVMSATFANVAKGRYSVQFRIHSMTFGTTARLSESLRAGQTAVSVTMTVCSVGDIWDRLDVVLFKGGTAIDTETVVETVVCPPR